MTIDNLLVWGGALISFAGLAGLLWCIVFVARARRAKLDDAALRAKLQRALPVNLGALLLSAIGLMLVVVGIFLG
ncbi:MAG: hypothetical protein AAF636_22785 [Pseudomonadota bacterium]